MLLIYPRHHVGCSFSEPKQVRRKSHFIFCSFSSCSCMLSRQLRLLLSLSLSISLSLSPLFLSLKFPSSSSIRPRQPPPLSLSLSPPPSLSRYPLSLSLEKKTNAKGIKALYRPGRQWWPIQNTCSYIGTPMMNGVSVILLQSLQQMPSSVSLIRARRFIFNEHKLFPCANIL